MATCDVRALMPDAKCFLPLTDKQMGAVIAALLCRILQQLDPMATCNVSTLMAEGSCYLCFNLKEIAAIQTALLCNIATNAAALLGVMQCGPADPVADPGVNCSFYYNTTSGGVWYWNDGTGAWVPLIV